MESRPHTPRSAEVLSARNRLVALIRHHAAPARIEDAHRDLKAAKAAASIDHWIAEPPPLSADQRALLAARLAPACGGDHAAA